MGLLMYEIDCSTLSREEYSEISKYLNGVSETGFTEWMGRSGGKFSLDEKISIASLNLPAGCPVRPADPV